jgi:hypothetical protein
MDRKLCSRCPRPADFSLAFLVSTIGVRPRGQKCTQTVPFCKSCLRDAAPFLATPFRDLQEPLRDAYTALGGAFPALSAAGGHCLAEGEAHQGGEAAPSCRLCLIACNSRKFTRQAGSVSTPASEEEISNAG